MISERLFSSRMGRINKKLKSMEQWGERSQRFSRGKRGARNEHCSGTVPSGLGLAGEVRLWVSRRKEKEKEQD
jgi:hypothetical protein